MLTFSDNNGRMALINDDLYFETFNRLNMMFKLEMYFVAKVLFLFTGSKYELHNLIVEGRHQNLIKLT